MYTGILFLLIVVTAVLTYFVFLKKPEITPTSRSTGTEAVQIISQTQADKLIAFLEEADNAYIKAYQYRSLGELIQYVSRELAIEMQQKITYYNDKIWGTPAHRQRSWTIVSTAGPVITVRKELTFKNVKYGRMLVKLGDDSVEYWKVVYNHLDERYKIQDITC